MTHLLHATLAPGIASLAPVRTLENEGLKILRSENVPVGLHATVTENGAIPDIMYVGAPELVSVSERLAGALGPLTGVRLVPHTIETHPFPRWLVTVTGRCGDVDFGRSEIERRMGRFLRLRGLCLTSDADADLAIPGNYIAIVVSDAAASTLGAGRFSNLTFVRIEDFLFDIPASRLESTQPRA
jgi:hypothetical protein